MWSCYRLSSSPPLLALSVRSTFLSALCSALDFLYCRDCTHSHTAGGGIQMVSELPPNTKKSTEEEDKYPGEHCCCCCVRRYQTQQVGLCMRVIRQWSRQVPWGLHPPRMSALRSFLASSAMVAMLGLGYGMWSLIAPGEERQREIIKVILLNAEQLSAYRDWTKTGQVSVCVLRCVTVVPVWVGVFLFGEAGVEWLYCYK